MKTEKKLRLPKISDRGKNDELLSSDGQPVLVLEDDEGSKQLQNKMLNDLKCTVMRFPTKPINTTTVQSYNNSPLKKQNIGYLDSHSHSINQNTNKTVNNFKRCKVDEIFVHDFLDGHFHNMEHINIEKNKHIYLSEFKKNRESCLTNNDYEVYSISSYKNKKSRQDNEDSSYDRSLHNSRSKAAIDEDLHLPFLKAKVHRSRARDDSVINLGGWTGNVFIDAEGNSHNSDFPTKFISRYPGLKNLNQSRKVSMIELNKRNTSSYSNPYGQHNEIIKDYILQRVLDKKESVTLIDTLIKLFNSNAIKNQGADVRLIRRKSEEKVCAGRPTIKMRKFGGILDYYQMIYDIIVREQVIKYKENWNIYDMKKLKFVIPKFLRRRQQSYMKVQDLLNYGALNVIHKLDQKEKLKDNIIDGVIQQAKFHKADMAEKNTLKKIFGTAHKVKTNSSAKSGILDKNGKGIDLKSTTLIRTHDDTPKADNLLIDGDSTQCVEPNKSLNPISNFQKLNQKGNYTGHSIRTPNCSINTLPKNETGFTKFLNKTTKKLNLNQNTNKLITQIKNPFSIAFGGDKRASKLKMGDIEKNELVLLTICLEKYCDKKKKPKKNGTLNCFVNAINNNSYAPNNTNKSESQKIMIEANESPNMNHKFFDTAKIMENNQNNLNIPLNSYESFDSAEIERDTLRRIDLYESKLDHDKQEKLKEDLFAIEKNTQPYDMNKLGQGIMTLMDTNSSKFASDNLQLHKPKKSIDISDSANKRYDSQKSNIKIGASKFGNNRLCVSPENVTIKQGPSNFSSSIGTISQRQSINVLPRFSLGVNSFPRKSAQSFDTESDMRLSRFPKNNNGKDQISQNQFLMTGDDNQNKNDVQVLGLINSYLKPKQPQLTRHDYGIKTQLLEPQKEQLSSVSKIDKFSFNKVSDKLIVNQQLQKFQKKIIEEKPAKELHQLSDQNAEESRKKSILKIVTPKKFDYGRRESKFDFGPRGTTNMIKIERSKLNPNINLTNELGQKISSALYTAFTEIESNRHLRRASMRGIIVCKEEPDEFTTKIFDTGMINMYYRNMHYHSERWLHDIKKYNKFGLLKKNSNSGVKKSTSLDEHEFNNLLTKKKYDPNEDQKEYETFKKSGKMVFYKEFLNRRKTLLRQKDRINNSNTITSPTRKQTMQISPLKKTNTITSPTKRQTIQISPLKRQSAQIIPLKRESVQISPLKRQSCSPTKEERDKIQKNSPLNKSGVKNESTINETDSEAEDSITYNKTIVKSRKNHVIFPYIKNIRLKVIITSIKVKKTSKIKKLILKSEKVFFSFKKNQ